MSITLHGRDDNLLWSKQIDQAEFERLQTILHRCQKNRGLLATLTVPARTQRVAAFLQDLAFPMTLGVIEGNMRDSPHFTAVNALRSFTWRDYADFLPLTIPCDLLTLPIRLLTAPPKLFASIFRKNALRTYLRRENAPREILNKKCIKVKVTSPVVMKMVKIATTSPYNSHYYELRRTVDLTTLDRGYYIESFEQAVRQVDATLSESQKIRRISEYNIKNGIMLNSESDATSDSDFSSSID